MKSRWNDDEARNVANDLIGLRVYTSRLLGQEPDLVLHGGGNTSVKAQKDDFFGNPVETLLVKGSGWDLRTIEEGGFAPVAMNTLHSLAKLESLSDSEMVAQQRMAMLDPNAPNASVEAILHAIIPYRFVDHTHADAVLAITNTSDGEARIRSLYGNRVIVIPYVMPGFALARLVYKTTRNLDWNDYEGMVLMNHGVFTFSDDGRASYEKMIQLVTEAEDYLERHSANAVSKAGSEVSLMELARIRKTVSEIRGAPLVAVLDKSPEAAGYAAISDIKRFGAAGPLTPDHSILAKRIPAIIETDNPTSSLQEYASGYRTYFDRNANGTQKCLDLAPRWAIWPGCGIVSFGAHYKRATAIKDIAAHTAKVIQSSEALGGWVPLNERDVFDVEYWELEQAKLKSGNTTLPLQGKIALLYLQDAALAEATVQSLLGQEAAVVAQFRESPEIAIDHDALIIVSNASLLDSTEAAVKAFGGIDLLITDESLFSSTDLFDRESDLAKAVSYLALGIEPKIGILSNAPGSIDPDSINATHNRLSEFYSTAIDLAIVDTENGSTLKTLNRPLRERDFNSIIEDLSQ